MNKIYNTASNDTQPLVEQVSKYLPL